MDKIESLDILVIQQQKEWSEILTGFEARNKYMVMDKDGNAIYGAAEWAGSTWKRIILKQLRPFTIYIINLDGSRVLILQRPFKFFFHRLEIFDSDWNQLGSVQRQFSLFTRKYLVLDRSEHEIFELFGPVLRPWTFIIRSSGREIGKITKKWSGFLKEMFTSADNFGVTFPADLDITQKSLLLGAVFLIDFVHFERRAND
jgi:uncharacterized protein YxjI